ncbi:MAG: hypothetical protein EOO15_13330 [Chitinophagaceae bacterium]|nr:MAG: hypothetical protein EOO15_13330 [Chitinophagaceae bacterium]
MDSALGFAVTPTTGSAMTLTFKVKAGYRLNILSFSFYNRTTATNWGTGVTTGYKNWLMTINGLQVGADTMNRGFTMVSTGTRIVENPANGLMGTVTVVLNFTNSFDKTGTLRIDSFTLNGYVEQIPDTGHDPVTTTDGKGYRYGFNGKEYDGDVTLDDYDYGLRFYDSRIGRFLSVDPLASEFAWNSVYSYAEDDPTDYIDIDGAETGGSTAQGTASRPSSYIRVTTTIPQTQRTSDPSTRLFSSGQVNSGAYAPQTQFKSQAEIEALIPPRAGAYINPDGVTMTVYNCNTIWTVSLIKPAETKRVLTWVDRALMRLQDQKAALFNRKEWNVSIQAYEVITTAPSTLDDKYLEKVNRRLLNGTATAQDLLYAGEVNMRKTDGRIKDPTMVEFTQGSGANAKRVKVDLPEGFRKTGKKSHGQNVYTNGSLWITPDTDGHSGGTWKVYSNESDVGRKQREGTADANLNIIAK